MEHPDSAIRLVRVSLPEYFELFLTVAGVLFAILVTVSELSRRDQEISLIFLIWLQGFILWAVHRYNWLLRRGLIQKVHSILQDRMKDQFAVMLTAAQRLDLDATGTARDRLEAEFDAAQAVSVELERIAYESLRTCGVRDASLALSATLISNGPRGVSGGS